MTTAATFFQVIREASSDADLEAVAADVSTAYALGEMPAATAATMARLIVERGRQIHQLEQPTTGKGLSTLFNEKPIHRVTSKVLGEDVLWAAEGAQIPPENDLVVYRESELRELAGRSEEALRVVHRIKKSLDAVLPDSVEIKR